MKKINTEYIARLWLRDTGNHPVHIETGDSPPRWEGEEWYFTTPGGTRIEHPNAYKWPKVYHPSTLAIHVGARWLYRHRGVRREDFNGKTIIVLPEKYTHRVDGFAVSPGWHRGARCYIVSHRGERYFAYRSAAAKNRDGAAEVVARLRAKHNL